MKKKRHRQKNGETAVSISVKIRGKELEKRLHSFLNVWKEHVHDEISIHKNLLSGRQGLGQHLRETVRIHEKFLKKLKKI